MVVVACQEMTDGGIRLWTLYLVSCTKRSEVNHVSAFVYLIRRVRYTKLSIHYDNFNANNTRRVSNAYFFRLLPSSISRHHINLNE